MCHQYQLFCCQLFILLINIILLMLEENLFYCQHHFGIHRNLFIYKNIIFTEIFFFLNRLPFDHQTPNGYFSLMLLLYLFHVPTVWGIINNLFFYTAFIWFLVLFTQQLKYEFGLLNSNATDESRLNEQIGHIIDLHCEAKQLISHWFELGDFISQMLSCLSLFFFVDLLRNFRISIELSLLAISYGA